MKIPFISNLKKHACASKREVLELKTLQYIKMPTIGLHKEFGLIVALNLKVSFVITQPSEAENSIELAFTSDKLCL